MSVRAVWTFNHRAAILANVRHMTVKPSAVSSHCTLAIAVGPKKMSTAPTSIDRKVSIRREPKSETFEVQFRMHIDVLELTREFNFNRKTAEPVETFLSRLTTNMEKGFGKKLRKTKAKLGIEKNQEFLNITADLRQKGKALPKNITCEDVFFKHIGENSESDLQFILCGIPFRTEVNVPHVTKLALPDVAMVGLPLYPLKVTVKFTTVDKCQFRWFTSIDDGKTWRLSDKSSGLAFYPSEDDACKLIKLELTPFDGHKSGDMVSAVLQHPVRPSPGPTPLPHQKRHSATRNRTTYPTFRVISYNILADTYAETEAANNELFSYCPPEARAWTYRRQLLMDELRGYNGDIVCLQEVDSKAFEFDLNLIFPPFYRGVFNKKLTNREGVATFYDKSRYKLLGTHSCFLGAEIDTNSWFSDWWEIIKQNQTLADRVKGLGSIAQAVVLSDISQPEKITIVGNTHLYFHPDADHIRLLQGGMYARFLSEVRKNVETSTPDCQLSLIACGDFNSVPSCGIYSLFTKQVAASSLKDWKSKELEEISGIELHQSIPFASAYGTPQYTNFTKEFADCLDYIFYQRDKLQLVQVVPLPSETELRANVALPSVVCPSDHLALVADLKWTN